MKKRPKSLEDAYDSDELEAINSKAKMLLSDPLDELAKISQAQGLYDFDTYVAPAESTDMETVDEPSAEALAVAKFLLGTPQTFLPEQARLLRTLTRFGIAVDVGDAGWVRGHRWRSYMRKV